MEITKGFYDFCVPYSSDKQKLKNILKELYKLGYRTVAIEQIYDHTKRDASKKQSDLFPPPADVEFAKEFEKKLRILHRLTIIYSDVAVAHAMTNSLNIKKYNLIAGLPKTEAALNHCCTTLNADIVSFDQDDCKLLVNRKTYQVAVKRGMCFEVKYVPIITNSSHRKDMIKVIHNYHSKGKCKNIIFSSGATNVFDLRGPYDIANLALIFGLSEEQGKSSVSSICRTLHLKAESRRLGKTIMFVKNTGPIVFSSSEAESDDDDSDMNSLEDKDDEDDESMSEQQPHKKKKLC